MGKYFLSVAIALSSLSVWADCPLEPTQTCALSGTAKVSKKFGLISFCINPKEGDDGITGHVSVPSDYALSGVPNSTYKMCDFNKKLVQGQLSGNIVCGSYDIDFSRLIGKIDLLNIKMQKTQVNQGSSFVNVRTQDRKSVAIPQVQTFKAATNVEFTCDMPKYGYSDNGEGDVAKVLPDVP